MRLVKVLILMLVSVVSFSQGLTLESIWKDRELNPDYLSDYHWKNDSIIYIIKKGKGASKICEINLLTGDTARVIPVPLEVDYFTINSRQSHVIAATKSESLYRRSRTAVHFVVAISSGKIFPFQGSKQMAVSFSPGGEKVSYVTNNNIVIQDVLSGSARTVTSDGEVGKIINGHADWVYEEEFSLTKAYEWSEDGNEIAFLRFDESKVPEYTLQYWDSLYPVNYTYKYPKSGKNNADVGVLIYNLKDQTTRIVYGTSGEVGKTWNSGGYIPRIQWVPKKKLLSIQLLNRAQNNYTIIHADSIKNIHVVFQEASDTYLNLKRDLVYLQKKPGFIYLSDRSGSNHVYYRDYNRKRDTRLTRGSIEVKRLYGLNKRESLIYYKATNLDKPQDQILYRMSSRGKNVRLIGAGVGCEDLAFSPNKQFLLYSRSSIYNPEKTAILSADDLKERKVLVDNVELIKKLSRLTLPKLTFEQIETTNGQSLCSYMIKPPDFDPSKKYPVLIYVYGGPGYQTVLNRWQGGTHLWHQWLATQGYIVVSVDPRGTGGRGSKFQKCTYKKLGTLESLDVLGAAKYYAGLPFVDKSRIGIWGWSFGGYLSSLSMFKGGSIFKMGIAVAPVSDWRFYDSIYTERFLSTPKNNPKGYVNTSVLNYADRLRGKYLLIHGTADDNVHIQNTYALQTALMKANKQFDLQVYTDKNHGIYGGNTRYHLFTLMSDYILKNL